MAIDPDLAYLLREVRSMIWTDALSRRSGGLRPDHSVSLRQLEPEVTSLRLRIEARVNYPPQRAPQAIAGLLPLPILSRYPAVIPALADAVRAGHITPSEIECFLLTSEYDRSTAVKPPAPTVSRLVARPVNTRRRPHAPVG